MQLPSSIGEALGKGVETGRSQVVNARRVHAFQDSFNARRDGRRRAKGAQFWDTYEARRKRPLREQPRFF
eukprot:9757067-Alexandrium_andersonii.AAC.1